MKLARLESGEEASAMMGAFVVVLIKLAGDAPDGQSYKNCLSRREIEPPRTVSALSFLSVNIGAAGISISQ